MCSLELSGSELDMDSATTTRTHAQRLRARIHIQRDDDFAAAGTKQATSTDAPEAIAYNIMGKQRIYNDDLNKPVSPSPRQNTSRNNKHRRQGIKRQTARFASLSLTCRARPRPRGVVLIRSAAPRRNSTQ